MRLFVQQWMKSSKLRESPSIGTTRHPGAFQNNRKFAGVTDIRSQPSCTRNIKVIRQGCFAFAFRHLRIITLVNTSLVLRHECFQVCCIVIVSCVLGKILKSSSGYMSSLTQRTLPEKTSMPSASHGSMFFEKDQELIIKLQFRTNLEGMILIAESRS